MTKLIGRSVELSERGEPEGWVDAEIKIKGVGKDERVLNV